MSFLQLRDAKAVEGNFTGAPERHVACALAMSTVITEASDHLVVIRE